MTWLNYFILFVYFYSIKACNPNDYQAECFALHCFANATNVASWIYSEAWLTGASYCEWYGITCDGNGHVLEINLNENNLKGFIPECIGHLRQLETLSLYSSRGDRACPGPPPQTTILNGSTLPRNLTLLTNLKVLDLGFTNIGGSLPNDIYKMSQLEILRIPASLMTGTIPQNIQYLSNLIEFKLERNPITGTMPVITQLMPNLKEYACDFCALTGTIPDVFDNTPALFHLVFDGNYLTGTIPASVGRLKYLSALGLNLNALTGPLPENICYPPYTEHCHIGSDTSYGPPFCAEFPWIIKSPGNKFSCPLPSCAIGNGVCNATVSIAPCI
jgi:hypothetical protein